jgi:hypothetical protein
MSMAKMLIVGGPDTGPDAAGWYVTDNGLQPIPGWTSQTAAEVRRAVNIIHEGNQLETPGLAQAATRAALDYVIETVAAGTGNDTVIVIGGPTMGMDSPGTVITIHSDGTVTVGETPGWEETWSDAFHAANILREGMRLSEPALAEATMNSVASYLLERTVAASGDRATMILM